MKKWIKVLFVIVILLAGITFWYANDYYRAEQTVSTYRISSEKITINETSHYTFFETKDSTVALAFYPGGKVEAKAYSQLAYKLAQQGISVLILNMPLNLAIFDSNAALKYISDFPSIQKWYIGGHSLGGVCAGMCYSGHSDTFSGLVLLAAYCNKDIQNTAGDVLSIYGTQDHIMNRENYKENYSNLPAQTVEFIMDGGNHCQFGNYGFQDGDGKATITTEQQLDITVQQITKLISK